MLSAPESLAKFPGCVQFADRFNPCDECLTTKPLSGGTNPKKVVKQTKTRPAAMFVGSSELKHDGSRSAWVM